MANIGNLALKLTANASGMLSALDKAERRVSSFAQKTSATLLSPLKAVQKIASLPGDAVTGFLKPVQGLLSSIPFVGSAFAAIPLGAAGFQSWIKQSISDMVALDKESKRLGMSTTTVSAFKLLAGGDADSLERPLLHFRHMLGELKAGKQEASDKLQGMGLDPSKFVTATGDQALAMLMDHFHGLKDETIAGAHAFELFGERGAKMLPFLMKGSEALEEAKEAVKAYGLAFDPKQLEEVKQASRAMRELDAVIAGVGRQLAIGLSPLITEAAKQFTDFVKSGHDVPSMVKSALVTIGEVIDAIIDGVGEALAALKEIAETAKDLRAGPAKGALGAALVKAARPDLLIAQNLFGGEAAANAPGAGGIFGGRKKLKDLFGSILGEHPQSKTVGGEDTEAVNALAERARVLTRSLGEQAAQLGMTAAEVEIYKIKVDAARLGMSAYADAVLRTASSLAESAKVVERIFSMPTAGNIFDTYREKYFKLDDLFRSGGFGKGEEALEKWTAAAKKLGEELDRSVASKAVEAFNSTRTPLEKFKNDADELQKMLDKGKLDPDVFNRKLGQLVGGLESAAGTHEIGAPGAALKDSTAAYSAIAKAERNRDRNDPVKRIQNAVDRLLIVQDLQKKFQEQMVQELQRRGILKFVGM